MSTLNFLPEGWNEEVTNLDVCDLESGIEKQNIYQGIVKECDEDFNLHIALGNGLKGVIPREEVESICVNEQGLPREELCTRKVHDFVQFKIKKLNPNHIILSRKEVQKEAIDWIKNKLEVGQKVSGVVRNIKRYGAFVEIGGGVVGLIHIEDLSVARIKTPFERLQIGQKVEVVVKSINRDNGRVILSYKELLGTWEENIQKFESGTKVQGIIRETEKNKNGIFVELTPNLVGMAEYEDGHIYGQTVDVYIKKIDMDKKKVKLLIV